MDDEITQEQRRRMEANHLAAIAKRKALATAGARQEPWKFFKCRKISSVQNPTTTSVPQPKKPIFLDPPIKPQLPDKFMVRLEICSPDSFVVTPLPINGSRYPGEAVCLERLRDCLSNVVPSHYTQNHVGAKACVYKLRDYDSVIKTLKVSVGIEYEEIPWSTFNIVEKLSHSFVSGRWIPCRPEHLPDEQVDELMGRLPKMLLDVLLPFQVEGVRFGLRRGGRCLIADEMGLGKTLQAIAIAGCFMSEGPILVVCPAILRFTWAEELERWLPSCLPSDIHLVFGHQNNPVHLTRFPKVVVISYTMLHHLRRSILEQDWAVMIVDESHHVRCTKRSSETKEVKAVLDVAAKVNRIVLLSGTPSLSRPYDIFHQINMLWPGMLGTNKYEFAKTYCSPRYLRGCQGFMFQDFSRGVRLEELNVLLKQTVMIRRLKEHVLMQLPPLRRQIINLVLKKSDIDSAIALCGVANNNSSTEVDAKEAPVDISDEYDNERDGDGRKSSRKLSNQVVGLAKLSGFQEWLSMHPIIAELDAEENIEGSHSSHKMIIFAHHHTVIDGVQRFLSEKAIEFVCIDGRDGSSRDRQIAIQSFQSSKKVKIAIIGILSGGSGLNLSAAQSVVFLELPQTPSDLQQIAREFRAKKWRVNLTVLIEWVADAKGKSKDTLIGDKRPKASTEIKKLKIIRNAESRAHRRGQTKAVNVYIFCAKDTPDESHWKCLNRSLHRVSSTMDGKYDAVREIEVESVSCLETREADTKEKPVSVREASAEGHIEELMKLYVPHFGQEMQPVEATDGTYATANSRQRYPNATDTHSSQNYNSKNKGGSIYDLEMGKCSILNMETEEDSYEAECGSSTGRDTLHNSLDGHNFHTDMVNTASHEIRELNGGESADLGASGGSSSIEVNSLRFEVSKYTGRIHLYECTLGVDSRPRPLFENFRPEELETEDLPAQDFKKRNHKCFKDNPAYKHAILAFINEWNSLRPIEQSKLFGKPLQLPLTTELYCLNKSLNHDGDGLLKGGSKKRASLLEEISKPLPSNAVWKKVFLSYGKTKREYTQGWTLMDEPLCKLCQTVCKSNNAKAPEFFEDLFCNLDCYEEYRLRTSNRGLREGLFQIEHGICTNCHLDCHKLVRHIKPLSNQQRQEYIKKVAPQVAKRRRLIDKLVHDPTEGNAWHADHIVPVYQGGGECRLENMRTLCVACHADVTAAQCSERRLERVKARKQLNAVIKNIKNGQNLEQLGCAERKDSDQLKTQETIVEEDELLMNVPGSAYSGETIKPIVSKEEEKNSDSAEHKHGGDIGEAS